MEVLAIINVPVGPAEVAADYKDQIKVQRLLRFTIEQTIASTHITRTVVCSPDPVAARIAQSMGALAIDYPEEVNYPSVAPGPLVSHVLNHALLTDNYWPDLGVLLSCGLPPRRAEEIDKAIELLTQQQADSLFSAYQVLGAVWRATQTSGPSFAETGALPVQQEDPGQITLEEEGSIYVFKSDVLRRYGRLLGGKVVAYTLRRREGLEADAFSEPLAVSMKGIATNPAPCLPELGRVQILVLDFDGVMTDNRVLVDETGKESVWCHRGDGWGIARIKEAGIRVFVISTETNPVVAARCRKLDIPFVQGSANKLQALEDLSRQLSVSNQDIAYIGNDVNDLACLGWVGLPVAVADAHPLVLKASKLVLCNNGGYGAVREVCDLILQHLGGNIK